MIGFLALLLTLAAGATAPASLQASGDAPDRQIEAGTAGSMTVDGVLDEADWSDARPATDFVQFEPNVGTPSAQTSAVRVLAGADALYIGAELSDSSPEAIRRTLSRRDDTGGADAFAVAIDSYDDGRTARLFGVTAAGVQFDALVEGNDDDDSWDAVWASGVRVTPRGWTVEIRIPYSQLRFNSGSAGWGINFIREIPRLGEESYWAPFTRDQESSGIVQFFGRLSGIEGVRPRRLVQAIPYTLASGTRGESAFAPGEPDYGTGADAGVDLKLGLSPGVILDATVNPDFGQVEADPAELNLSTFETFFQERRPFFLEGTQIFDNGFSRDGALLYTRRIGGSAPIVGATKLTGTNRQRPVVRHHRGGHWRGFRPQQVVRARACAPGAGRPELHRNDRLPLRRVSRCLGSLRRGCAERRRGDRLELPVRSVRPIPVRRRAFGLAPR